MTSKQQNKTQNTKLVESILGTKSSNFRKKPTHHHIAFFIPVTCFVATLFFSSINGKSFLDFATIFFALLMSLAAYSLYFMYMLLNERKHRVHKTSKVVSEVKLLDSSVIVNSGFADYICRGFMSGLLCIPDFVLQELHIMADSSDASTREKGKIGLSNANKILSNKETTKLVSLHKMIRGDKVDELLLLFAEKLQSLLKVNCFIVTGDGNLEKMALCRSIQVHNMNTMMFLLKKPIFIGDLINASIIKKGERRDQGIGYAEDGTMLVIEEAGQLIGSRVQVEVQTIRSTESGRVAFCRFMKLENQHIDNTNGSIENSNNIKTNSTSNSHANKRSNNNRHLRAKNFYAANNNNASHNSNSSSNNNVNSGNVDNVSQENSTYETYTRKSTK